MRYLRKGDDLPVLAEAIRDAVAGGQPISPELAFILVGHPADRPHLTEREREVLEFSAQAALGERWRSGGHHEGARSRSHLREHKVQVRLVARLGSVVEVGRPAAAASALAVHERARRGEHARRSPAAS